MIRKNTFTLLLVLQTFFLGSFLLSLPAHAANTVYVSKDGDDESDGTNDHPYKTLEEASEDVNEGKADSIKIGKGTFDGGLTFSQGVEIIGSGRGDTVITGKLIFEKKLDMKNLSVKASAGTAVMLGKGANATIKNVDIQGGKGIAISVTAGSGSLTLSDSRIHDNGKGIYAQAGTKITVEDNDFFDNTQEAIDIRQNTRGTIRNNNIQKNKESGIEIILGSSDFLIIGNKIQKNGASGIANQFYTDNKKLGSIRIENNTITGNRNYDIDCKTPSGGGGGPGYWANSVILTNNIFTDREEAVHRRCKIIQEGTEEELKALEEEDKASALAEENKKPALTLELESARQEQLKLETLTLVKVINTESVINDTEYAELKTQVENTSKFEKFWLGFQGDELDFLEARLQQDNNLLEGAKQNLAQDVFFLNNGELQDRIAKQAARFEEKKQMVAELQKQKGILGDPLSHLHFNPDVLSRLNRILYVLPF